MVNLVGKIHWRRECCQVWLVVSVHLGDACFYVVSVHLGDACFYVKHDFRSFVRPYCLDESVLAIGCKLAALILL